MTQYQRFELSRIDGEIAELEKKIAAKHEQRRELVNRMGLNKGGALKSDKFYVVGESGTDTLTPNKCEHKRMGSRRDEAPWNGPSATTKKYICADCGLPWQHEELKP